MKVLLLPGLLPLLVAASLPSPASLRQPRGLSSSQREAVTLFSLDHKVGELLREEELGRRETQQKPRVEKSLLNTFPFNHGSGHEAQRGSHGEHGQQGGEHHGEHGGHHGEQHGEHGDHHEEHPSDYSATSSLDRSASSAPPRERFEQRVREEVGHQVRQQLTRRAGSSSLASSKLPGLASKFRQFEDSLATSGPGQEDEPAATTELTEDDQTDQNSDAFNLIGQAAAGEGEGQGGRKCVDKVMMVEETVYDEVITCDHSYDKRCHTSYVTNYDSQQEEECEENFRKVCQISYEPLAYNETVQICRTPIVKDCDVPGETSCQTVYDTECSTTQKVHEVEDDVTDCHTEQMTKCRDVTVGYVTQAECDEWPVERCTVSKQLVRKYTPETACYKEPRTLCAPRGCGFRNGTVECHDKIKTIVVDNPQEECELEPQRTCKHVTKLVPRLVAVEECVDVPKEVCARSRNNPRRIKKPIIKKWCYVPSEESGLA